MAHTVTLATYCGLMHRDHTLNAKLLSSRIDAIQSPLIAAAWSYHLSRHTDCRFSSYIAEGIVHGFRIGSASPALLPSKRNMKSAYSNPNVVDDLSGLFLNKICLARLLFTTAHLALYRSGTALANGDSLSSLRNS